MTPNTSQVWERWMGEESAPGAAARPAPRIVPLCRRAVQWVRRWRARWGVRRAKAKTVSPLMMPDLRRKAGSWHEPGLGENPSRAAPPEKRSGRIPAPKYRPPCHAANRLAGISRPENGLFFSARVAAFVPFPEAEATFQWDRFLLSRRPEGHTVVRINMDETS